MKKQITIIVAVIIVLAITGIIGKVVYDKVYTIKASEEIKKAGLNPENYDILKESSSEEIREAIIQQEINNTLSRIGISPDEIDLSDIDFTGRSPEEIYDLVYAEVAKQNTKQSTKQDTQTTTKGNPQTDTSSGTYDCIADPAISKRGYIVIHGSGGPDASQTTIKNAVSGDPKYGGFLYFTYNANQENLATISSRFVKEYNTFIAQGFDKVIIYGQSAGGVIASYTANQLGTSLDVEIHTLASPLNGYKFGVAAEQMSQQLTGFYKEIGLGFDHYTKPASNVTVYHHKTVEDQTLRSFCGSYASLCSPSVIQNNNVPGSSEFSYPDETHDSISNTVVTKTLSCRR